MDIDSASVFLSASILYALGFLVILIAVVVSNNIIHRYWKSFGWNFFPVWLEQPQRFVEPHELDKSREPKV